MKQFVNFVIRNKLAVWLLTFIITFFGIYAGTKMKTEIIPDISIPYLMVMNVYPGATPEQVMDDVSIPFEKTIENLDGVKNVYSDSYANMSTIQVEYEYGIDMKEAERSLKSSLEKVQLPESAQDPIVSALSMNMMPVVVLSVSGEDINITELTTLVEGELLEKMKKIDGVANISTSGQHFEEVYLTYNEEKLKELNLTEDTIEQIIQASDLSASLGLFTFNDGEESVFIDGKYTSIKELENTMIPVSPTEAHPSPFVVLKDIASVEISGKVQALSRTNGNDAIALQVFKAQQANTVDVVNQVKNLIKEETNKNPNLSIDITMDTGEPIEKSVSTMIEKALFGGLIAILIILLFLRDFKSTVISIISIPVSIFIALLLLDSMEITLNLMTLGAITVAIGRVIDDSIVVVENIYRRIHLKEEKLTGIALIRESTIEMFKPILSSTLVTVAVFAPLIFVGGMVGELFMPFALTMTFALGASLLVAITIVPALSHFLFKKKLKEEKSEINHTDSGKLSEMYKSMLNWTLNHKIISLTLSFLLLIGSLALTPLIGFSFLGSEEEKVLMINYTPKTGELNSEIMKNVSIVEEELLKHKDIEIVQLTMSEEGDLMNAMMGGGANGASIYAVFDPETKNFSKVSEDIDNYLGELNHPGTWSSQTQTSSSFSSDEISYTFKSENLDSLNEAIKIAEEALKKNNNLEDVSSAASNSFVEHTFIVDQNHLMAHGLTAAQIMVMLNPMETTNVLTTIEKDGKELEVIVKKEEKKNPETMTDLLETPVPTVVGMKKLSDLVEVKQGTTMDTLSRNKGEYYATVSGKAVTKNLSKVTSEIDETIHNLPLPNDVSIEVSGVTADMNETFTQLGLAMIGAILIVYFILVVTFGEGLAPFAILFSLPFAVIGSFVGLLMAGETISVPVMMGLLMLIGIVVTNAIVLVDRIIHKEREGLSIRESILDAVSTRLRPILMTAIATIGALIPLLFGSGGGGLISKGLGITVIGGLTSSTLLTLIVVPIVYELLSKWFKKNRYKDFNEK